MKKKGFTLIELIIVIAIIGVLTGIMIPSWSNYIQRSRTRAQNLKAKTIFNAVQTFATDMKFEERRYVNILRDPTSTEDEKNKAKVYIFGEWNGSETVWCFYYNDVTGSLINPDPTKGFKPGGYDVTKDAKTYADAKDDEIMKKRARLTKSVNNIIDETGTVYKVYVKDYKVISVASARSERDRYIGTYPLNLDQLEDKGIDVDAIRSEKIRNLNMANIAL